MTATAVQTRITKQINSTQVCPTDQELVTLLSNRPGARHFIVQQTRFCNCESYLSRPKLGIAVAAVPSRNALIASVAAEAAGSEHNVLVLAKRRDHLPRLKKHLEDSDSTLQIFELHGGQSEKERKKTLEDMAEADSFILLAMSQVVGEGIDVPALDTLVLAASVAFKGNVIQQVGRVTRDASGSSSSAATVHDFLDKEVPALAAAFRKRSSVLKKQGFTVASSEIRKVDRSLR